MKLPTIITPSLVHSLKSNPQLPKHTWYIVSSVTLSALNRPDEIPAVFRDAIACGASAAPTQLDRDDEVVGLKEQLRIARRMREALVKSAAVIGVPRVSFRQH